MESEILNRADHFWGPGDVCIVEQTFLSDRSSWVTLGDSDAHSVSVSIVLNSLEAFESRKKQ